MWRSLWRTLLYACMLVVCVTVLSLIIALVLNSVKKCRVFVKSVFFFPAMLGSVAVALIWDQMFYQLLPAVGKMMGVNLQTPLADPSTAIFGVLFVNVWQAVAMPTIILLAGLQSIPDDLYESAMIDGATRLQIFTKITLPLSKPIIVYTALMAFMGPWVDFIFASVILGDVKDKYTVALGLYQMLNQDAINEWFLPFTAGAIIIAIPITLLFIFMQKYYVEGVTGGSVK